MSTQKPKYYNALIVNKTKDGKDIWTKVGVAFPHKNSDGLKVKITDGISVHGELLLQLPKAGEEAEDDTIPF